MASAPSVIAVVLAAGKGRRTGLSLAKPLLPLAGLPLIGHVLRTLKTLGVARIYAVIAEESSPLAKTITGHSSAIHIVTQTQRQGTGHAAQLAVRTFDEKTDPASPVLFVNADTPLLEEQDLLGVVNSLTKDGHDLACLGFYPENPEGYGRLLADKKNLRRIVEEKDASPAEKRLTFCHAGVIALRAAHAATLLPRLGPSAVTGEYYLTDVVALAHQSGLSCSTVRSGPVSPLGVNSLADLAQVEAQFQRRKRHHLLTSGVIMPSPDAVWFAHDTQIDAGCRIDPYVWFDPGVRLDAGCHVRSFSHLAGCHIEANGHIGPFARIRPECHFGKGAKIGTFVEIKNSLSGEDTKIAHHAYIGDACLGSGITVGAGVITCNYDGVEKHVTHIGDRALIGANSSLVAPLSIGPDAYIASGSTITTSIDAHALGIGRSRSAQRPGWARRFFARKRGES